MVQVEPVSAFNDNYIWCIRHHSQPGVYVVDPGDATPVLAKLDAGNEPLLGILLTHHHWDHTDGVKTLTQRFAGIPVYGPKNSPFGGVTHPLEEGDLIRLFDFDFNVLQTPGHTLDHICYVADELCFCGDTLFSGGCGRLFEGSPQQMWQSLSKLAALPDDCKVYCTHEYTQANLAFAKAVEPDNKRLGEYAEKVDAQRAKGQPSIPTNIALERDINPFLRAAQPGITAHIPAELKPEGAAPEQVFAALRKWKDGF